MIDGTGKTKLIIYVIIKIKIGLYPNIEKYIGPITIKRMFKGQI